MELSFVFRKVSEIYPKTILDVGTGTTALPHLLANCGCVVTASDNVRDYWPSGMVNRHFYVLDDDIQNTRITQRFEMITWISVLEHIRDSERAMRGMFSLLDPGGYVTLTCPFSDGEYVDNVYERPGSSYGQGLPYATQSFSEAYLQQWLSQNNAELVEQECWQFWEGAFWTEGRQMIPPKKVGPTERHQLRCLLLRKN